ncbi:MAG: hypothetical protein SGJ27_20555 [Candidatus Melainabacteria bacterium]|nr:hypothetical protein [Candidatus Melainabacteria bacterium]
MRLFLTSSLILIACCISGCASGPSDKVAQGPGAGHGVLGKMHPRASAATLEELKASEAQARAEQIRLGQEQGNQSSMNGMGRVLPPVSTDPLSPPGMMANAEGPISNSYNPGAAQAGTPQTVSTPAIDSAALTPAKDMGAVESPPPATEAASYSQHYMPGGSVPPPPPGAVAGGLVPPPPAVTLSTNANIAYGEQAQNPYANPGWNPYAIPAPYQQYPYQMPPQQQQMMMPPPMAPPEQQQRPAGLFGSGKKGRPAADDAGDDEDSDKPEKKEVEFVPIRPTGMEARSPYKQKDDIKVLWSGALTTFNMQKLQDREKDLGMILKKIDVGLPPDATKGMFTVAPRRVASLFRPIASERKSIEQVRKTQFDVVQSYYRYLYAYNKYAIGLQTVQARKQEIEVAGSRAEKQRAEADLARSQDAAQSSTEDMRAAQEEMAAVAGAQAARSIIGRISGITPSVQALTQAEKSAEPIEVDSKKSGGMFGGMGSLFSFGGNSKSGSEPKVEPLKEPVVKAAKPEKGPKTKSDKKGKIKNVEVAEEDLAPSRSVAMKGSSRRETQAPPESPKVSSSPISFELKDVEITARKSILTVAIHNTGSETFKFTPDVISLAEGDKKIDEASMRAEFDSTSVRPNAEVQGKITIFGRPWNDRLSVVISDGSNNIQLKRNRN